jgi:molybdopterin synthase sulfur carrier subunit
MDELNVLVFGQLKELVGASSVCIPCIRDTDELRTHLCQAFPALQGRKFMIAVDQVMARDNTPIGKNAQIALLPPFSGG